jgi:hypothetical protein
VEEEHHKEDTDKGERMICKWALQNGDAAGFICLRIDTRHKYWASGLCPRSGIPKIRKRNVLETGSVSFLK